MHTLFFEQLHDENLIQVRVLLTKEAYSSGSQIVIYVLIFIFQNWQLNHK